MKTFCLFATVAIILLAGCSVCSQAAQPPLVGTIQPASAERITVLVGDKAKVDLGTKDGLIKGDIGTISLDKDMNPEKTVGQCAVTRTELGSSACELITASREVEKGNYIFFDPVSFADANIYSMVMTTLANVVDPYEPHKDLRVCVYGVFDKTNAVTGFSQQVKAEFEQILPQKKRIHLVDRDAFHDLVLYPELSSELVDYVKSQMKRRNVDILILATYWFEEGRVKVKVLNIDRNGYDKTVTYAFPLKQKFAEADSKILVAPSEPTRVKNIPCTLAVKSLPKVLPREDRLNLVKFESAGNALTEQTLRRIDFNIVNPVEVKAVVDGEVVDLSDNRDHHVMLATGSHSLTISFKRGYFYNETLLYTSETVVTKQAMLSLGKGGTLSVDVNVNAVQQKEPVTLSVYHPMERQRQILKPIVTRIESERTIDTYKD